jgi:peptidoglycan/xylan/chitin deacetylase (PgdA/CDA1 family)
MRTLAFLALRLTWLPCVLREVVQRRFVTVLVYHRPSPQVFATHLSILTRLYNIIPLSRYVDARRHGDLRQLPPKALIITLDDGHCSNYALKDVLEMYNVPVTIFLCSGLIGTRRRFWFLHEPTAAIVQQLKTLPDDERLAILREMGFEETQAFDARQALSGCELQALEPLADFQSHTVFHPILQRCSPARAEAEIIRSKLDLQARFSHEVYALAYPNGDYAEREWRLAERAGYKCAVTLDRGFNTARTPLFRLRRICIPDDADLHELLVKASGLWGGIRAILDRRTA